jgi:hypothetical protein
MTLQGPSLNANHVFLSDKQSFSDETILYTGHLNVAHLKYRVGEIMRPLDFYGCETWSHTIRVEL